MNTLTYVYGNKIYINLTNRCSNSCDFCIRNNNDGVADYYLWLTREPTAAEVEKDLMQYDFSKYSQAVFCGFGEPLYAIDVMIEVGVWLKAKGVETRVNTNGQARFICGEDAAQKLKNAIDVVSISLNASDAEKYNKVCHCVFGDDGFYEMLKFAVDCKEQGIRTVFTVVDVIGADEVEKCRKIAESIGVEFRVRAYVEHYESEKK